MKTTRALHKPRHRLDPSRWAGDHRDYLIRFALQRMTDHGLAEDLVQETFLSAWSARGAFRGDCAERTWLTGILRNKIVDHWRRQARRPVVLAGDFDLGREGGDPTPWLERRPEENQAHHPREAAERAELLGLLVAAIDQLPAAMGQAYRMRELQGCTTEEITRALGISASNLWVLIHRAKQSLKEQLRCVWPEPALAPERCAGMAA